MAKQVDYLPVAAASGSNVDTQAAFAGSGYQTAGFQNGTAFPNQANKCWRQASMMAAALATFISNNLNINILDDGNLPVLITNLTSALRNANASILAMTFNPAAVFDASQASKFEMTLTGNINPTLVNTIPGQELRFVIHQDGVGGRVFTPPSNLPMDPISPTAGSTSTQSFVVQSNGTLMVTSPMVATG
jgi:hypothetical protein